MSRPDLTAIWIQDEQRKSARRVRIKREIQGTLDRLRDNAYNNGEIIAALEDLAMEIKKAAGNNWRVIHVGPSGVRTEVDRLFSEAEATDAAEYMNTCRNAAEFLDGTIFEVEHA